MNKIKHDIRESSPVENLIGNPPASIVRWGISAIAIVFVIALTASWLISYPYIISGKIVLSTSNPPASMMAHTSGQIKTMFVEEGQKVRRGEYLALIETTADIESVQWLSRMLEENLEGVSSSSEESRVLPGPDSQQLGELRTVYPSYKTTLDNYINNLSADYYGKKIEAVQDEIDGINDYLAQLEVKERLYVDKLKLVEAEYLRDSTLYSSDVRSLQELEDTKRMFYDEKILLEQVRLDKKSRLIDRASRYQSLEDFKAAREDERRKLLTLFRNESIKLQGELELWYMKHLLKSPIDGRVTLSRFWGKNQVVQEGDIVMTIVPEIENRIIGRVELSMKRSGEVEPGQKVLIKLGAYPFLEYGIVEGIVESVSKVATDDIYIVDVSLPDGMRTNYEKDLQFNQNMSGTAEIITEEMRLIERIIYPFRYLIEKNSLLKGN
jgi:HlyD family secretion protein